MNTDDIWLAAGGPYLFKLVTVRWQKSLMLNKTNLQQKLRAQMVVSTSCPQGLSVLINRQLLASSWKSIPQPTKLLSQGVQQKHDKYLSIYNVTNCISNTIIIITENNNDPIYNYNINLIISFHKVCSQNKTQFTNKQNVKRTKIVNTQTLKILWVISFFFF